MSTSAERVRRYRDRKRRGVKTVRIEIDGDIASLLVAEGYLEPPTGARGVVRAADVAEAIERKLRDEARAFAKRQ